MLTDEQRNALIEQKSQIERRLTKLIEYDNIAMAAIQKGHRSINMNKEQRFNLLDKLEEINGLLGMDNKG